MPSKDFEPVGICEAKMLDSAKSKNGADRHLQGNVRKLLGHGTIRIPNIIGFGRKRISAALSFPLGSDVEPAESASQKFAAFSSSLNSSQL